MALIQWAPVLSVGVTQFDNEHKKLVDMVNNLYDAIKAGKANSAIGTILDELVRYTGSHFGAEERLMQQHGYSGLAKHKAEHAALVKQVLEIQKGFKEGKALPQNLLQFLRDWLMKHIVGEDKQYGPFLNTKGVK